METTLPAEPVLDKPGAGVPKIEQFVGKWVLRLGCRLHGRRGADRKFEAERAGIRGLYEPLPAQTSARRVLISRLRGLEDSSRYWSVWMCLDHLRIVNGQIARVIGSLVSGVSPEGQASTAAVKPSASVDAGVVELYEKSCDQVLRAASKPPTLRTGARYSHPWFGPLDAAEWHAMAGMHMAIHGAQIVAILRRLRSPGG